MWGVFCPTLPARMQRSAIAGTTRLPWAIMSFRGLASHPCGGRHGRIPSARECVLLLFLWGVFCPTLPTRMEGMAVFHPLNVGTTRLPWAIMSFRERGAHVTPPPHPCGGATAVKSARVGFSPKSLIPNGTATVTDVGQCARVTHTKWYSDCIGLGGVVP